MLKIDKSLAKKLIKSSEKDLGQNLGYIFMINR